MLVDIWPALVEPKRRAILDLLCERPRDVGDLVEALGVTQPTASKHLRVLRDAGLVRVVYAAQRRVYSLEPEPLARLDDWLSPYRQLWNDRLDALGRHLDR
ncbi:MAG: ArsR/SmtB family transcription factor [Acidimicrobiales bacterium]